MNKLSMNYILNRYKLDPENLKIYDKAFYKTKSFQIPEEGKNELLREFEKNEKKNGEDFEDYVYDNEKSIIEKYAKEIEYILFKACKKGLKKENAENTNFIDMSLLINGEKINGKIATYEKIFENSMQNDGDYNFKYFIVDNQDKKEGKIYKLSYTDDEVLVSSRKMNLEELEYYISSGSK